MIRFDNDAATDAAIKSAIMDAAVEKKLKIEIDGNEIPAQNIVSDSLRIEQSLMDSQTLKFGGCIASTLTVTLMYIDDFLQQLGGVEGKKIQVWVVVDYMGDALVPSDTLYPSDTLLPGNTVNRLEQLIYTGFVNSMKRLKKRIQVELTAYDELYNMAQTKCKGAISGAFDYSPVEVETLLRFMRWTLQLYDNQNDTTFAQQLNADSGFQNALSPHLSGATKAAFNQYAPDDLTVADVLNAHCELNARFAYIAPNGDLRFTTFFKDGRTATTKKAVDENVAYYQNLTCEDFLSAQVMYLSFPYNGGNNTLDYGVTDNKRFWYISDNIITKCMDNAATVSALVTNFWRNGSQKNYIFYAMSQYRPFQFTTFGEFWIELGDRLTATVTVYNPQTGSDDSFVVDGFVLHREIRGITNMKVTVGAEGRNYLSKEVLT